MKSARLICLLIGSIIGAWIFYAAVPWLLEQLYTQVKLGNPHLAAYNVFTVLAVTALGVILGVALIGNPIFSLIARWDEMHSGDRITLIIGIVLGVVFTGSLSAVLINAGPQSGALLTVASLLLWSALSIRVLQSMDDILPWSKNYGKGRRSTLKILDTNVIIDGRIYEIVRCGFLDGELYVPKFVLEELQYIADNSDNLRRQRGKRGLDILQQLQSNFHLEVGSLDRYAPEDSNGVDSRLVRLARATGGSLVTNDHNLNRVAALQDVQVLNINELALGLRPNVLPGETMTLQLHKEGSQPGQGVGYLDDGTMVVVEDGRRHLGDMVEVEITQVHQTERGKMLFAEILSEQSEEDEIAHRRRFKR